MIEKDLLNGFNVMEELVKSGEIEKYTYSSEDGFAYYYTLDENSSKLEEEEIGLYDIDREYIIEEIREAKKQYEQDIEDEKEYCTDRERAYWEVQGVQY